MGRADTCSMETGVLKTHLREKRNGADGFPTADSFLITGFLIPMVRLWENYISVFLFANLLLGDFNSGSFVLAGMERRHSEKDSSLAF